MPLRVARGRQLFINKRGWDGGGQERVHPRLGGESNAGAPAGRRRCRRSLPPPRAQEGVFRRIGEVAAGGGGDAEAPPRRSRAGFPAEPHPLPAPAELLPGRRRGLWAGAPESRLCRREREGEKEGRRRRAGGVPALSSDISRSGSAR